MLLVLTFYRVHFSCPYRTYFQGYVDRTRIHVFQYLNVFLRYRVICCSFHIISYFLNLLRPYPARPTKPVPSSISVVGSGTGEPSVFSPTGKASELLVLSLEIFLTTLGVLDVNWASSPGQPAIPKNSITTHKSINSFFILSPP